MKSALRRNRLGIAALPITTSIITVNIPGLISPFSSPTFAVIIPKLKRKLKILPL